MSSDFEPLPDWLAVSRETQTKLRAHLALVAKWTPTVNLISRTSINEAWFRHTLDSAQVWYAAKVDRGVWLDLGSGAGFPGVVVAIIAQELAPQMTFTLIESDRRKAAFLREVARQLHLSLDVRAERIEVVQPLGASVISARALAPLDALLSESRRLLDPSGIAVFPKGQSFEEELLKARGACSFDCEVVPSKTDSQSVILRIGNIHHA